MTKTKTQKKRNRAREDERLATAMEAFTLNYGRDETKLETWQLLCEDCGLERGRSITMCKAVCPSHIARRYMTSVTKKPQLLRTVAVNIWDLVRARENGDLPVPTYRNKMELRLDLRKSNRRFPLGRVKCSDDNKLLKALLVTMA